MLCNIDGSPIYPCAYRELIGFEGDSVLNFGLSLCVQGTFRKVLYSSPSRLLKSIQIS